MIELKLSGLPLLRTIAMLLGVLLDTAQSCLRCLCAFGSFRGVGVLWRSTRALLPLWLPSELIAVGAVLLILLQFCELLVFLVLGSALYVLCFGVLRLSLLPCLLLAGRSIGLSNNLFSTLLATLPDVALHLG